MEGLRIVGEQPGPVEDKGCFVAGADVAKSEDLKVMVKKGGVKCSGEDAAERLIMFTWWIAVAAEQRSTSTAAGPAAGQPALISYGPSASALLACSGAASGSHLLSTDMSRLV